MSHFSDPAAVARYAERPIRLVPGFLDLQKMAAILLAERAPPNGDILVLGAGGGLELKVFADGHPDWRFVGVDPSAEMLDLAAQMTAGHAARTHLHHGYIDTAPLGPFDGATCLLTLHFVAQNERLATLRALHDRLKPGAPLVVAHHSIPTEAAARALWLNRYAAFATASGVPAADSQNAAVAIGQRLPVLSPAKDEALLRAAGFADVSLFYAGFSFRGWVGYAG